MAALVALVAGAAACTGARHPHRPAPPGPIDVAVEVPPGATPQPAVDHTDGVLSVRLLYAECGIETIVGTHAEYTPRRPLCRVRVRLTAATGSSLTVAAGEAALVEADGSLDPVASDVAGIEQQSPSVELGGHDSAEVSLWFEPRHPGLPVGLRLPTTLGPDGAAHVQPPLRLVWDRKG